MREYKFFPLYNIFFYSLLTPSKMISLTVLPQTSGVGPENDSTAARGPDLPHAAEDHVRCCLRLGPRGQGRMVSSKLTG